MENMSLLEPLAIVEAGSVVFIVLHEIEKEKPFHSSVQEFPAESTRN